MLQRARLAWSWLGAGQIDSGFAALGGFIAGVTAVRTFEAPVLGVYALLFAGFALASQLATQILLSPSEILAARYPPDDRAGLLRWSIPRGAAVATLGGGFVLVLGLPFRSAIDPHSYGLLVATCALFTVVSPIQDHVRRVAHLAGRSWVAAVVSATFMVGTLLGVMTLPLWDGAAAPYGAMAIGNFVSLLVGLRLLRSAQSGVVSTPTNRQLFDVGRWLLLTGGVIAAGRYLVSNLVASIAGAGVLGIVESARVASRPADVVATGLIQPIGPRLMAAAAANHHRERRRLRRLYFISLALAAFFFLTLTGWPHNLNPVYLLIPNAYETGSLLIVVMVAIVLTNLAAPYMYELLGKRKERSIGLTELAVQGVQVALALSAFWVGAYSIPLSQTAGTAVKTLLYRRVLAFEGDESTFSSPDQHS